MITTKLLRNKTTDLIYSFVYTLSITNSIKQPITVKPIPANPKSTNTSLLSITLVSSPLPYSLVF